VGKSASCTTQMLLKSAVRLKIAYLPTTSLLSAEASRGDASVLGMKYGGAISYGKFSPHAGRANRVNRTAAPTRRPRAELRTRELPGEVDTLIEAARANRRGQRDATMILPAFRHGLRASEVCDLRWDQVEFNASAACAPGQGGHPEHPSVNWRRVPRPRRLQREIPPAPFVLMSEPVEKFAFQRGEEALAHRVVIGVSTVPPASGRRGPTRPSGDGIQVCRVVSSSPSWTP
jgi:hypothetical protein